MADSVQKRGSNHRNCAVPSCTSYGYVLDAIRKRTVTYHKIPKPEEEKKAWLRRIKREESSTFKVKKHTVVCSLHFLDEDMEKSGYSGRWKIIRGRLPSVFNCWKHRPSPLARATKKRKLKKQQQPDTTCTYSSAIASRDIKDVNQIEIDPSPQTVPNDEANNEMTFEDVISQLKAEVIGLTEQLRSAVLKIKELETAASEMGILKSKYCRKGCSYL